MIGALHIVELQGECCEAEPAIFKKATTPDSLFASLRLCVEGFQGGCSDAEPTTVFMHQRAQRNEAYFMESILIILQILLKKGSRYNS